jgi:hypothetical protein
MKPPWPVRLLDQLEIIDGSEAPHGLYGIRRAYAPEGSLPTMAQVLGSPGKVGLREKCGFGGRVAGRDRETLSFGADGDYVSLRILDYATTKVRHFGSAFRVDRNPGKASKEPAWDLASLVPKLRSDRFATHALLLVAHTAAVKEIEAVLGKCTDPVFVDRYTLEHHQREWDDRYGRGFRTALHLWAPRSDRDAP